MNALWLCIVANFLQRARKQGFLVALLATAMLTLLFFPSPDADYQTLIINGYRGIYNSAWIGICLAMLSVLFLPIISFFLVKSALEMDRQSKAAELIAATPIGKGRFLFAKWCVNVALLFSVFAVMLVTSLFVQIYYGESYLIDLWALLWPQLIFVMPMLLAVASIALLFESNRHLKGGLGNLIFVFLWLATIVQTLESVSGVGALINQLEQYVEENLSVGTNSLSVGVNLTQDTQAIKTFVWPGTVPNLEHFISTLPFLAMSLLCFVLAYFFFDRYRHATELNDDNPESKVSKLASKLGQKLDSLLSFFTQQFAFTRLVRLELKLLLKGQSTYWLVGVIILNLAQILVGLSLLTSLVLPLSWLWCVLVLSQLGQMGSQWNTRELITYSQRTPVQQVVASASAAWCLLVLVSLGGLLRLTFELQWLWLAQTFVAISFTTALASFSGTLSGTRRLFEVLYPIFWYIGPSQGALYFDFFGVRSEQSWQANMPVIFLIISLLLMLLTLVSSVSKQRL